MDFQKWIYTLVFTIVVVLSGQAHAADEASATRADNKARSKLAHAWDTQYRKTAQQHLRALAQSGRADDLVAAALLAPVYDRPYFALASGAERKPSAQARKWLDAARALQPRDSRLAWLDALGCMGWDKHCDSQAALQFLLQTEPENAAVQILAIQHADTRGDQAAASAHWRALADTTRYATYELEISRLLHAAVSDVDWPTLDAAVSQSLGEALHMDSPTTQNLAYLEAMGPVMRAGPILPKCTPNELAQADAQRRGGCERALQLMADNDSHYIIPLIGLSLLAKSFGETTPPSRCEKLRQLRWLHESYMQNIGSRTMSSDYLTWSMTEGEIVAVRNMLEKMVQPTTAPADWESPKPCM